MLKELQLHNNGSDDDNEESKLDDTDDLINFGFKDVEIEELDTDNLDKFNLKLEMKINNKKNEKTKKDDSFEL